MTGVPGTSVTANSSSTSNPGENWTGGYRRQPGHSWWATITCPASGNRLNSTAWAPSAVASAIGGVGNRAWCLPRGGRWRLCYLHYQLSIGVPERVGRATRSSTKPFVQYSVSVQLAPRRPTPSTAWARAMECFGNAGAGSMVNLPGTRVFNWDMTFAKNFPLKSERRVLIFRAEMYNIFNHPQFTGGNITPSYDWNNWKNGVLVQTSNTLGRYNGTREPAADVDVAAVPVLVLMGGRPGAHAPRRRPAFFWCGAVVQRRSRFLPAVSDSSQPRAAGFLQTSASSVLAPASFNRDNLFTCHSTTRNGLPSLRIGTRMGSCDMRTRFAVFIFLSLLGAVALPAQKYQSNWDSLDKRPTPAWFSDAKFGIFIHWGVYSVPAYAPVLPGKLAYAEWYWHAITEGREAQRQCRSTPAPGRITRSSTAPTFPTRTSRRSSGPNCSIRIIGPTSLQRSGAQYVVLTSKHHEGFALWPSTEASATWGRPWNAVEIGPASRSAGRSDDAVRAKGLKMGFYYSLYEWYNPLWLTDKPRYVGRAHVPAVQGRGDALQAGHHLQRRRMGPDLRRMAQPGTAGLAVQRVALQGRSGHQRPLGQRHAATSTAATGPPNTRPA